MTRLVLVRHGESNSTVARTIGGHRTCSGLSDLGRRQAEALRDRWLRAPELAADVVIASHYPRAQETAQIVLPALGGHDLHVIDGFGEHDPGPDCDGLTFVEYSRRFSIGPEAWRSGNPFAVTFPGGETVASFQYRVGVALAETLARHSGKTIVLFCHGGVIDALLRLALKAPAMGAFEVHTLNTSITEMEVRDGVWRLLRYNDSAHLAGLPHGTPVDTDDLDTL